MATIKNSKLFESIKRPEGDRDVALSYRWQADYDELDRVLPMPDCVSKRDRQVAASILYDVILKAKTFGTEQRISYSRRRKWWSDTKRYRGTEYSYDTVLRAVHALADMGYIVDHRIALPSDPKFRKKGEEGRQSTFRPADCLADLPLVVAEKHDGQTVVLKNVEGGLVGYKDTERTERDRKFMERLNRRLAGIQITLDAPHVRDGNLIRFPQHAVNADDVSLYRVYSGGWTLGGRLYGGWWQGVPKKARQFFRIDGEKVHEEDYKQIHPRMLYATLGLPHPDDAYTVPGWEDRRDACKKAFNTLINADSFSKALSSLANTEHFNGNVDEARRLLDDIQAMHGAIARYFCTGIGLKLQYFDSEIAKTVLSELEKQGIAALPVHDSFVVQERHKDVLVQVMEKAFREATKAPGFVGDPATESKGRGKIIPHMRGGGSRGGSGVSGCPSGRSKTEGAESRNCNREEKMMRPVFGGPKFGPVVVGNPAQEKTEKTEREVLEVVDDIGDTFFSDVPVSVSKTSPKAKPAAPSFRPAAQSKPKDRATSGREFKAAVKPSNEPAQRPSVQKRPSGHPKSQKAL